MAYNPKIPRNGGKPAAYNDILVTRAEEVINCLMEHDGFVNLSKREFAQYMYDQTKRSHWLTRDKSPNKKLVEDVCNLTRDQHCFPEVAAVLGGYMVTYAPQEGGLILVGSEGEMKREHLLHLLVGDLTRQQAAKTINRRRVAGWETGAKQALRSGDHDLGLLMGQIKNEIDASGFVSDTLAAEFLARVEAA